MQLSIRKMTLLGLCLSTVIFFLCFFFLQHYLLDKNFIALEQAAVRKNVERTENAIKDELQKLDDSVVDWAVWDDTFTFMQGKMQSYIDANLNERSIAALRLAVIAFVNNAGDIVWAQSLAPSGGYVPTVPEGLQPHLGPGSPLLRATTTEARVKGLLRLPQGLLLTASCPILDSEGHGPKRGTLIMGRLLDSRMTADIADRIRLTVSLEPADRPLPADLARLGTTLAPKVITVLPVSDDEVTGTTLIEDLDGRPALRATVRQPRDVISRGDAIVNQTGLMLAVGGGCLLAVIVLFVERRVLARLAGLTRQVDAIVSEGDTLGRVAVAGTDELGILGQRINAMLAEIEKSHLELSQGYAEKQAQEAYLRQILDSIQAGVLLVDPQTRQVVEINQFAVLAAGRSRKDIVGKVCHDLLCPAQDENCPMDRMPSQTMDLSQCFLIRADGTLLPILKSVSHIMRDGREHFLETFIDVHELHEARAALAKSEEHLRRIIDTLPIGIIQASSEGQCLLVNPCLARMVGYASPRELLETCTDIAGNYLDRDEFVTIKHTLDTEGALSDYPAKLRRHDGGIVWANLSVITVHDAFGAIASYIGFVQDITLRRENEREIELHRNHLKQLVAERTAKLEQEIRTREKVQEELLQAKIIAETANKTKSAFLANMSHEIRTPLNGVLGMLQLLEQTPLDDDQRDCLESATQAANRLTSLLSDILDISRIEADKLTLQNEAYALTTVRQSVLALFQTAAWKKGLDLTFSLDAGLPPLVVGDESRLRQILFNLVGNAVKFTEKGKIRVEVFALPDASPTVARVLFVVSDTGIGIPDEQVRCIFDPFVQAERSYTRHFQGAGLGLSIVRKLVRLMGGELAIDNAMEGGGTAFYLSLPLTKASLPPDSDAETGLDVPPRPLLTGRILIAEDDTVNLHLVQHWLETAGHVTVAAGNGLETLDLLGKQPFDLILMDIQMPVMNGIEAVKTIRTTDLPWGNAHIPIIAMTAYAMEGDRETFLAAGMDAYMAKPLNQQTLLGLIDHELQTRRAAHRAQ